MFLAAAGRFGVSQLKSQVAANAPANCAAMKGRASAWWMPAKVSEKAWDRMTAGLAKEVEAVNE